MLFKKLKIINDTSYYLLSLMHDKALIITVPKSNNFIRNLISKKECKKLIESIPSIDIIRTNNKLIEM